MSSPQDSTKPAPQAPSWLDRALPGTPTFFRRKEEEEPAATAPGLERGKVVGDFQLCSMIGQGGMGQVWTATQASLGDRRVALKFVRPERLTGRMLEFFQREARAGGRLSHPGIVAVYAYGESGDLSWIAMEFVEGGWTLRDFIDEMIFADELPPDYDRHVVRFIADVAEAMQSAHDAGVIHRDLKPSNVLITEEERPKVTDFGLAKIVDETALTETGELAGSYRYMSPEQVAGDSSQVDHRSDVFSLGVVLYEMLTLRRPFQGDTSHQVVKQIALEDPPDPRSIRSRIPRDLVVITNKALEKKREQRYASMADFAADLRRFIAGEPVTARPPSSIDRSVKWMQRNPTKSIVGAVVFASIVVLTIVLLAYARRNAELFRLSAMQDYDDLVSEAGGLWPVSIDGIEAYRSWIDRAEALTDDLPIHRAKQGALRAGGELESVRERWWDRQLSRLIGNLESLGEPSAGLLDGVSPEHGWGVRRRLEHAERAKRGEWSDEWELESIRAAYPGLEIEVVHDLVPLGADPRSGLWEFWHPASGDRPSRNAAGELELTESSGLVFVLIPAGRFTGGTQSSDANAPRYVPDDDRAAQEFGVHEAAVSFFYVSKFEMTQGQWLRLTGTRPSSYGPTNYGSTLNAADRPHTDLHPVEQVTWKDCVLHLGRFGLRLPNELEWEYAARAGSDELWSTGSDPADLDSVANLADGFAATWRNAQGELAFPFDCDELLFDGEVIHAPVGEYAPNAFGLHDVHGNVWELCGNRFGPDPSFAHQLPDSPQDRCVIRGGAYNSLPSGARLAHRTSTDPGAAAPDLGLRPAIGIP